MLPEYTLIAVPLGIEPPDRAPTEFTLHIVCSLTVPPGEHSANTIREALGQHPILTRAENEPILAVAMEFSAWERNGRRFDLSQSIELTLRYTGATPLAQLAEVLAGYLTPRAPVQAAQVAHDASFDLLEKSHFVDVIKAYDDMAEVTQMLQASALSGVGPSALGATTPLGELSMDAVRWVNSATHAALLEAISGRPDYVATLGIAERITSLRDAIAKVARRVVPGNDFDCEDPTPRTLRAATSETTTSVSKEDPNVALQAALKNPLLARRCGIVTSWAAVADEPMVGDFIVQISPPAYSSTTVSVISKATAFRRAQYTHPLAFSDLGRGTTNAGLAFLNDDSGRARYRASCINTETTLLKQLVVQPTNAISDPSTDDSFGDFVGTRDERPPQLLAEQQFGISEPETAGITFSAPLEDLATPDALRSSTSEDRERAYPCQFLEDLWAGFRLDLQKEGERAFSSVHEQTQAIVFSSGGGGVSGPTESYFEREQPDDPDRGHTSTEFGSYNGLTPGQARDYLALLGIATQQVRSDATGPFSVEVTDYRASVRILFGNVYRYRIRNVLLGGIGLSVEDADGLRRSNSYEQTFPFFRARAYRPGEVVSFRRGEDREPTGGGRTIVLSRAQSRAQIALVPAPIDMDAARFHGLMLLDDSEPERDDGRVLVSDISKFFASSGGRSDYYYDPDVSGVVVRAKLLNGAGVPGQEQFLYEDGVYCQAQKHLRLEAVELNFGPAGEWEDYRPVLISFSATDDLLPSVRRGSRRLEIRVPRAGDLEVSIVPLVSTSQLLKTASYAASNTQLARNPRLESSAARVRDWLPVPAVAEQVIRVVHAVESPLQTPRLVGVPYVRDGHEPTMDTAARASGTERVELRGRVEVDAASTGQVQLEATWRDIDDDPTQNRYLLTDASTKSVPRNIVFRRFSPQRGNAAAYAAHLARLPVGGGTSSTFELKIGTASYKFAEQWDLQCAENKVFLGPRDDQAAGATENETRQSDSLNVSDARRKVMVVRAVAKSRFVNVLPPAEVGAANNLTSDPVVVDVPASMSLSAPRVSHVLPLVRATSTTNASGRTTRTAYALRVYVHPRWYESGPGERLAIGCTVGDPPDKAVASLDKGVSQWGEDPIERPRLKSTAHMPRAADFTALEDSRAPSLDLILYPDVGGDSRNEVIYRDNVPLPRNGADATRRVSVASYPLRADTTSRLWYCDVQVAGDFSGWCGLALYRHQPNAQEGLALSEGAEWAYAAVLTGDTIAVVERDERLHVTIGPVYDPYTTYELHSIRFREGVSDDLTSTPDESQALQRYRVDAGYYFEGIALAGETNWNVIKKRFGYRTGSVKLARPR